MSLSAGAIMGEALPQKKTVQSRPATKRRDGSRPQTRGGAPTQTAFVECSGDDVYFPRNAVRILAGVERKPQGHPPQQGKVRRCGAERATKCTRQVSGVGEPGSMSCARDAGSVCQVTSSPLEPKPEN